MNPPREYGKINPIHQNGDLRHVRYFYEGRMRQAPEGCLPKGETLSAGVHGVTLRENRKKSSRFGVYVGITGQHPVLAEWEERKYLNGFYRVPD